MSMPETTLTEVLEFLRDNVPTKTELAELRQHMDQRFDDLETKLDLRERFRLVERRLAKLEDASLPSSRQLTPQT